MPATGVHPDCRLFSICPASPKGIEKDEARPGHHSAIIQSLGGTSFDYAQDAPHFWQTIHNDVEQTKRKPMLLLKLSGSFLLRYEQRALFRLLFHEPPRNTRACSWMSPSCTSIPQLNWGINAYDTFFQPPNNLPISATIVEA